MKKYTFTASLDEDLNSDEPKPIFDENDNLIGAFVILKGDEIKGFISVDNSPLNLFIEEGFSLTPIYSHDIILKRHYVKGCYLSIHRKPTSVSVPSSAIKEDMYGE